VFTPAKGVEIPGRVFDQWIEVHQLLKRHTYFETHGVHLEAHSIIDRSPWSTLDDQRREHEACNTNSVVDLITSAVFCLVRTKIVASLFVADTLIAILCTPAGGAVIIK